MVNTDDIDPRRYNLKCLTTECKAKKGQGACIQCAAKGCTIAIHPRCAFELNSGFTESDEVDEDGDLKLELFCPLHSKSRKSMKKKQGSEHSRNNDDNSRSLNHQSDMVNDRENTNKRNSLKGHKNKLKNIKIDQIEKYADRGNKG